MRRKQEDKMAKGEWKKQRDGRKQSGVFAPLPKTRREGRRQWRAGNRNRVLSPACARAAKKLAQIEKAASRHGIIIRVSTASSGRVDTHHWMFEKDSKRLLNYWPGNGTWYISGNKGKITDPWIALELAMQNAGIEVHPEKVDTRGLPCMNCDKEVLADEIQCLGEDYWICGKCANLYRDLGEYRKQVDRVAKEG